jgi:hypothetical protein
VLLTKLLGQRGRHDGAADRGRSSEVRLARLSARRRDACEKRIHQHFCFQKLFHSSSNISSSSSFLLPRLFFVPSPSSSQSSPIFVSGARFDRAGQRNNAPLFNFTIASVVGSSVGGCWFSGTAFGVGRSLIFVNLGIWNAPCVRGA